MRKNTMRTFAVSLAMAMMLAGCQTVTPPETTPVAQSTEEKTEEATTTVTDPTTTEPTSEAPTADETEEPTVEASTEDETTTEDATPGEETTEDGTSEEETNTEESTPEETSPEETTPEETTPAPTTPEPTTPEPTTPEPTTPEPTTPEQTTPAPKEPETTPAPVTAVSITGKVNGTHYIGDTLSAGDFVITVTMSDGSTLTNPAGFAVSPLTLSAATNTLTCAYGGVSGTFTVNATEKPVQPTQPSNPGNNYAVTLNGMEIVQNGLQYMGLPYVLGGGSLQTGTDCSNFTRLIYGQYGISLSGSASAQYDQGTPISLDQAKPGDLIVTKYAPGTSIYTGHAGIFVGKNSETGAYYMLSEMPDGAGGGSCGVTFFLAGEYEIRRVFNNTYTGSQTDGTIDAELYCYNTLHKYGYLCSTAVKNCIVKNDGTLDLSKCEIYMMGVSPIGRQLPYYNISNHESKYDSLISFWKNEFVSHGYNWAVFTTEKEALYQVGGKWVTDTEFTALKKSGDPSVEGLSWDNTYEVTFPLW